MAAAVAVAAVAVVAPAWKSAAAVAGCRIGRPCYGGDGNRVRPYDEKCTSSNEVTTVFTYGRTCSADRDRLFCIGRADECRYNARVGRVRVVARREDFPECNVHSELVNSYDERTMHIQRDTASGWVSSRYIMYAAWGITPT
uniref:Uncharacterized protein n=1 Tax=Sipha flava TaxID=143950 RepID=A0A2S2QDR1_9HEMI